MVMYTTESIGARGLGFPARAAMLVACVFAVASGVAQTTAPVTQLNPTSFMAAWHTIARYPDKREKSCVSDEQTLYALGDKPNTFQLVTSCRLKLDNWDGWNQAGRLDPGGSGRMRLTWFWFIRSDYWVIATAPDYSWALVGTPNHKSLWVLAKADTLAAGVLDGIKSQAAAQGFDPGKLVLIKQLDASTVGTAP